MKQYIRSPYVFKGIELSWIERDRGGKKEMTKGLWASKILMQKAG